MPIIPNRKVDVEIDPSRRYNREKLPGGEYLCVMTPWPENFVAHDHPFKEGVVTQSWPLRFEECTKDGKLGRQITLWVECDLGGHIAPEEVGELRWRPLADALELEEADKFNTDDLAWSAVTVVVKSKIKKTKELSSWVEDFKIASAREVIIAGDYLALAHPDV